MTNSLSAHQMVCVAVEIRKHAVVRRVRITASSIERALAIAGGNHSTGDVRLLFPVDAEHFFAGSNAGQNSQPAFGEAA